MIYTRPEAMPDLLERDSFDALRVVVDERLARRELRRQVARLERELAGLFAEAFGRVELAHRVAAQARASRGCSTSASWSRCATSSPSGSADARACLLERGRGRDRQPRAAAAMIAAPADHKWVRISRADVGEPGCGGWHSRPRLGPIGMLMGWWQVKVSSGCPLAGRLAAVEQEAQAARRPRPPPLRRPAAATLAGKPAPDADERPPAPWGAVPLAELVILAGIVSLAIG